MGAILSGHDKENEGEGFFQFMNPRVLKRYYNQGCEQCSLIEQSRMSDRLPLGVLDATMPEFAAVGETLQTLILSQFHREFDAPCPNCNPNHLEDGTKLKRAESTYLLEPDIIVVSLARRRS